jgi:hypothetical protein
LSERHKERLFVRDRERELEREGELVRQRERERERERESSLFWRESENPSENQSLEERERLTVCLSFQKISFAGL